MTTVVGNGGGNLAPWYVLSSPFILSNASSASFTASNSYGLVIVYGYGFTYAPNQLTGGTITSVGYAVTGGGSEGWAGFAVSAVAAYNAVATQNRDAFGSLFFGGGDTFNYTDPGVGYSTILNPTLMGFGGNDVFNITNTTGGKLGALDGGSGNDTLNLSGTYYTELPYPYNQTVMPNFLVSNFETINLAAGYNYTLRPDTTLVTSGNTVVIDARFLGASNSLTFFTNSYTGFGIATPAGNIALLGGAGNDLFQGGSGNNLFHGGGGSDTVSFDSGDLFYIGNTGVTVNLGIAGAQSIGGPVGGSDTFISIENLIGTSRNDTLTGDAGNNVLDGGSGGDDVLNGLAGDDTLIVHGANAILDGGSGYDTIVFSTPYSGAPFSYSGRTITSGGYVLTNIESAQFSDQIVQLAGPKITTTTQRIAASNTVALSSLFSVIDLTGDTVTQYQLWDSTNNPLSGHFVVNGFTQASGTVINITTAELALTSFVTGTVNDTLQIRAFDGNSWSASDNGQWSPFTVGPAVNHLPVVTTSSQFVSAQQSLALSSLFSVADADGDTITKYELLDNNGFPNSGYFVLSGLTQAAGTVIGITAAQVAQVSFVAGHFPAGTGLPVDNLKIRAFDGIGWGDWSSFNVQTPNNASPFVSTSAVTASPGQVLALSSLFSNYDTDGDAITRYQLWDATNDPASGHFVLSGSPQAAQSLIDITAAQVSQVSFVGGTVPDNLQIRAYDGLDWSAGDNAQWAPFTVSPPFNHPPVVSFTSYLAAHNEVIPLSSLLSIFDTESDPITKYQLVDTSSDPASGHFVVNSVVRPANTLIEITAAELAQTSFVGGFVPDFLQVRVFDGTSWSSPGLSGFQILISQSGNNAPAVTTANKATAAGQTLALSSLFSVSDPDGDVPTKYQLWDGTSDPLSGHFVVSGVAQPARALIEVTAAQLAATSFVAGSVSDTLQIRAFDGAVWSADDNASWAPFTVTPAANAAPVVTTANKSATRGQTLALSSLFSASDADGDAITKYQLWDGTGDPLSGHFVISGVAQPARAVIDITAAQLAATSFVAGAVSDTLQIRAFDGAVWSAADNASWAPFTVTPAANVAPVVTTANKSTTAGQTLALSSLFSVSDFEGDAITKYQLWDSTSDPLSGHFVISGVAQPARAVIDITAAQLAATSFVTGSVNDMLQIRAFDGISWSASDSASWAPFTVTVPSNTAPVVTTANTAATRGQTLALSSLFSVNDADGDAITKYQLWDGTSDPLSGHFVVNGVAQAARTLIELTPGQIALTSFVAGAAADSLQIRAFDGAAWSAPDSASWAPFTVTPAPNNAPVVTTADIAAGHGQTLALSSLFSVSDADGDAITRYQLWDSTSDPLSGHFVVNGVAQPERAVIDLTPSQIALTSLLVGTLGDNLQIRAFDGFTWSAPDSAQWAPFHVTAT